MYRPLLVVLFFTMFGCEQIIGLDDFKEGDEVEDSGDTSGDEISGEGDACDVNILDVLTMEGVCRLDDTTGEDCPGGTFPIDPKGTCPGDQPLKCCIHENQCERYSPAAYCESAECYMSDGWRMGCPDGQWCCSEFKK
ncbi:MAG: hypothetical protein GY866_09170 [Proteobacteria bacterium]|nr:hypothetical protein [Pseudomonadota bacterium]